MQQRALFEVVFGAGLDKRRYPELATAGAEVLRGLLPPAEALRPGDGEALLVSVAALAHGYAVFLLEGVLGPPASAVGTARGQAGGRCPQPARVSGHGGCARLLLVSGGLRTLGGGDGPGLLVLLHGLGATADVWTSSAEVLADTWPGRWLAVDLPGHGGSPPLSRVSFGALATAVADDLPPDEPVVVLGHSLGGVVGLALASGWFGVRVTRAIGLGIKAVWSPDELAKAHALAARPVSWFETREQAAARHLLVAGLTGLVDPSDELVSAGLREQDGRWRLALDPRSFGVGAPDLPGLVRAARADVVLACGEHDAMVSVGQLEAVVPDPVVLPDCGHNAHLERPDLVAGLLRA